MTSTTSAGIIGFGRFGKVLYNILQKGYTVKVYEPVMNESLTQEFSQVIFTDWETVLQEEVIFVSVPINRFEEVIKKMAPSLKGHQTVIDVCSVKVYPSQVMEKYLPSEVGIIATHPLFGPDSYLKSHGNHSHKIMMYSQRVQADRDRGGDQYQSWKDFFQKQGIDIVEMTPEEHDRLAAETQGLTHYLGRLLKEYGVKKTPIDTQGFTSLLHIVENTCHDTWELYIDLQKYNHYTQDMIEKINQSIIDLDKKVSLK